MATPPSSIPTTTAPLPTGQPETDEKDQRSFERWRRTLSLITGLGLTPEEFRAEVVKADQRECERRKEKLIKNSVWSAELASRDIAGFLLTKHTMSTNLGPGVRFMMNNLAKAGCPLSKNMLQCAPCDITKSGGFSKDHGILLCSSGFFSQKHQEHTMIHEMIHMYDHCVFNVDWDNLRHHACSEVRAAALSGDCNWSREFKRGIYTFTKQHQECVKRRAILSVEGNPSCPSRAAAERAVNAVFESCYNDTRPFDEFY
ncbi:Mitochondrial inner membrane protease atp23 [Mortierella sp. GBA43]|nr:Mitochondrial inner membrane protease atp23 [Mortierella sp. GBA43]